MKLRVTLKTAKATAIAAAVMAFAFLFSACESYWFYPEVELGLTSVKIGDLEITAIPAPILSEDWDDEEYEVAGSDLGFVIVKKEADLQGQTVSAVSNVPTAIVTWGLAKGGSRPARDKFQDLRAPATFDKTDFFFFKVFDPDKEETKYYKFFPRDASTVKELAAFSIAGRDSDKIPANVASLTTLQTSITNSNFRGQVYITRTDALGALVAATPQDSTARIRYAVAETVADAQAGTWNWEDAERVVVQDEQGKDITQGHDTMAFDTDGVVLAVEVTAQNDDVNYYGFLVYKDRLAAIANLTFGTTKGSDVVKGKGTEHSLWANVAAGNYASADQPADGFNVNIELEDGEGDAAWGLLTTVAAGQPSTFTTGFNLTQKFTDKQALAIRVRSPRRVLGLTTSDSDTRYYKIEVNLIAANFTRHPQSAAYEVVSHTYQPAPNGGTDYDGRILINASGTRQLSPETIEELSFALDREGSFTYQWYTANSWFGGYAFDREGRIAYDPGTIRDYYHPNPGGYDEKGNISYHNGGNQYYRLSIPGTKISGATQATYTPTIGAKNRPFITGFSNQTQYYWVEVTDSNGLKVISDRAAIVTEWGYEFEKGIPKTEKVEKKHHIVDLHAYMGSSPYGLMGNPRNPTAFKAGNHGDKYLIPITFPPGFNVKDYSVVTCWAKFYLADGKEWIQNWTQGDFGFADASGERLVLWYNLTNDNATRGLGSTGNEPQGGGLDETPAFLIVQPAGTKPMKEMPPFDGLMKEVTGTPAWPESYQTVYGADERPKPKENNDAQGWFTPYIEIVELRFEGPVR